MVSSISENLRTKNIMKYKVLCIVMLLIIGKVEVSIGGNKSKAESKQSFKNYIFPKSFDTSIGVLPKGYKGDDIVSIYNFLSNKYPRKDDFETKDAYESRINSTMPKVVLAFVRDRADGLRWDNDWLEYNPETEMMTINIHSNSSSRIRRSPSIIKIKRTEVINKGFIGQNAFGAKVKGSLFKAIDYGIYPDGGYRKITFSVKPEEGRVLKQDYGLLFIGKISPTDKIGYLYFNPETNLREIIGSGVDSESATISSPYEIWDRNRFISLNLMEIWVFNIKTGYIYFKEKLHTDEVSTNKQINE